MQNKYIGINPPVITPLKENNKLDLDGLEKLIEHILSGGVHGLFILGTTGEGPSLSYEIRNEVIEQVCLRVNGGVNVLVGISDTSFIESIKLSEKAADTGADAVVATPPYYFAPSQMELLTYFQALADESPLPLFLYNMPSHTKVNFGADTVLKLSRHPNIIGLKDSSGDLLYFQNIIRRLKDQPEFSLLVGPEEMLMQAMLTGGHGGVNGGANMFPKLYVAMYDAAQARDFDRMQKLQDKILEISSKLYSIGNSPMRYLQGVKCALSVMGICNSTLAHPFQAFGNREKVIVQEILESLNIEEAIA